MSARALIGAGGQRVFGAKMKKCSKCGVTKAVSEFGKDARRSSGYKSWCKECCRAKQREYNKTNKHKLKEYRELNKCARSHYRKEYHNRNKDTQNAKTRQYYENNRSRLLIQSRARRLKRTVRPIWQDMEPYASQIAAVYTEARRRSVATGILHHVDHIIPITNPLVCGLHVPWNLQVLTQFENDSKGNKWNPWWSE